MKKTGSILLLCIILVGIFTVLTNMMEKEETPNDESVKVHGGQEKKYEYTVIVDAGHGGIDPGKVGINGVYEMDINLSIAFKLADVLEENKIRVIMTRKDNNGLYSDKDSNKKMADMNKRVELVNKSQGDALISIHQNSFTSESAHGAQVFYYKASTKSEMLAECIQKELLDMDKTNKRQKKSDADYYIVKKSNIPAVIVECGFLSNEKEAQLLSDGSYQEKVAKAIAKGVMEYLNKKDSKVQLES